MEAKERRYDKQSAYISGSTVRKLNAMPERDYDTNENPLPRRSYPQRKVRPQSNPRSKRQLRVGRGIDFISMMILCIAMVVTLAVCFQYLQEQSRSIQLGKEIVALEASLKTLTDENNVMEIAINQPVDLDEVYRIAVGELGMVHPNHNTVIEYETNEVGYARQYEEIPSVDSDFVMDKLQP